MNLEQMIQRQQELLDAARAEHRELNAKEQAEFDSLNASIQAARAAANTATPVQPQPAENTEAVRAAEQTRCLEITSLCRDFGVSEEDMKRYISEGTPVDAVRKAVLEQIKSEGAPVATRGTADVSIVADEQDKFRAAAADALIMRSGMQLDNPSDGARDLMGMSLKDLAIDSLSAEGQSGLNRRSADEIFSMVQRQFFNPTSAFPAILDNAINKAYVEGHNKAPVTFDRFTKKGTLTDFKVSDNNYIAGPVGEFYEVPENGELKHDKPTDAKRPTRQLKTYGRQFTLSRQAFINDDIGLVTRIPARYAAAARRTINKQVYEILVNNAAIYDGTPLFSADHKNVLATGTSGTQVAMQKMITALGSQKDEFGEAIIIRPGTIVAPTGMSFEIAATLNSPTINTAGNTQAVNPLFKYTSQIEQVEDPTINALCGGFGQKMPWFLIGANEDTDFIEVDYLNGQEIPTIRRAEVPGTLGFVWDIYLDWGISVMDFRGGIKNPGIEITSPLS